MAGSTTSRPMGGMSPAGVSSLVRRFVPHRVIDGGVTTALRYGEMTAADRPLPDYLVIGVKKGGTTSMINWLVAHPDVGAMFPPGRKLKSPHYFDINYARGEDWYRGHFPTKRARARIARDRERWPMVGEASPYYVFHPAAPRRVLETTPQAKLVVLLRDPVSRAYSNYRDRVATGNEDLPTFEEALDAEPERLSEVTDQDLQDPQRYSFHHDHHSYLARGRYAEQLRRWFDVFPREQLLVLRMEDMYDDANAVLGTTLDFLGLPRLSSLSASVHNARSNAAPMLPETRQRLADYYRPHNAALYELLGRDFGWEARYPG